MQLRNLTTLEVRGWAYTASLPVSDTGMMSRADSLGEVVNIPTTGVGSEVPTSFFLYSGMLPPGIELDTSTGELFGTFAELGVYEGISIAAVHSEGVTPSNVFTWSVYPSETYGQIGAGRNLARGASINVHYGR